MSDETDSECNFGVRIIEMVLYRNFSYYCIIIVNEKVGAKENFIVNCFWFNRVSLHWEISLFVTSLLHDIFSTDSTFLSTLISNLKSVFLYVYALVFI